MLNITLSVLFHSSLRNKCFNGLVVLAQTLAGTYITPLGFFLLNSAVTDALVKLLPWAAMPHWPPAHRLTPISNLHPQTPFPAISSGKPEATPFHLKSHKALWDFSGVPDPCCPAQWLAVALSLLMRTANAQIGAQKWLLKTNQTTKTCYSHWTPPYGSKLKSGVPGLPLLAKRASSSL